MLGCAGKRGFERFLGVDDVSACGARGKGCFGESGGLREGICL